ncbi:hypothetical protein [Streptomyces sp. TRM64462]|uniref:hypothetical protein n=1 Tax=Streptomyces sp. TRM64462 TaxID=2741726 RepID=UPI001586C031|nr:hypothetical protein [Streptomyces sp. TRM64462]
MPRTTPPRPLDVERLFPELAAYRRTATRLHPRPGTPSARDSSVGGPLLWPADEPWPVCTDPHQRICDGRRTGHVRLQRHLLDALWNREPAPGAPPGPTDEDRELLTAVDEDARVPGGPPPGDPLPLMAVAQLYRRDIPDLQPGPDGADLLQVFWCPFDVHGNGWQPSLHLRWRHAADVDGAAVLPDHDQPEPPVVGFASHVPAPCVLHPEQVVEYPYADFLPEDLRDRVDAWEGPVEELATKDVLYQYDLSIAPGWKAGGYASWHRTDPMPMDCTACGRPMEPLLAIDSTEWDAGSRSWMPLEDRPPNGHRAPHGSHAPTGVTVGRGGELYVFTCPADPGHPHGVAIQ